MAKTVTGARAVVYVGEAIVGVFDSCNFTVNHGAQPIHILGRFSPAEIAVTSYEAVTVNCSGFRVVNHGAFTLPKFPKLEQLLKLEGISLTMVDRDTEKQLMVVQNCIPVNYSSGVNAKDISRIQISYLGTHYSDESGPQDEGGAPNLP